MQLPQSSDHVCPVLAEGLLWIEYQDLTAICYPMGNGLGKKNPEVPGHGSAPPMKNGGTDSISNAYDSKLSHRIHGAGIYANMTGVYCWDPCHHIYSSTMDPMAM